MDKDNKEQSRRSRRAQGRDARSPKDFPNYLIQRPTLKNQEERHHSTAFNGKEARTGNGQVPFLERKPEAGQQRSKTAENPASRAGQRGMPSPKKEERTRSSLPVFAQHKSRRPFRPTRLPSTWRKREEQDEQEYDFSLLKKELRIAERDLILIDLTPPDEPEPTGQRGGENDLPAANPLLRKRPNRALHRSLSGIMEQERVQESRKRDGLRLKRRNEHGYSSYFE